MSASTPPVPYDPDGDTFTVSADFGDGTSATGLKTCHAYGAGTMFTATISATDRLGATGTTSVTVTPGDFPPTLQLTTPPAGSKFSVGDIVSLNAVAKDHQGASLPVTVSTMMIHCPAPSDCHNHYDGAPQTLTPDAGGQVQYAAIFPDHGQNTSEQLTFTATNSAGTTAAQTYTILPNLHSLSVASPAPANIDGFAVSTIQAVAGSTNSVSVPTRYQYLTFTGWSDGGSPDHTLVMPNADTTLSANYQTAHRSALCRAWRSYLLPRRANRPRGFDGNGSDPNLYGRQALLVATHRSPRSPRCDSCPLLVLWRTNRLARIPHVR